MQSSPLWCTQGAYSKKTETAIPSFFIGTNYVKLCNIRKGVKSVSASGGFSTVFHFFCFCLLVKFISILPLLPASPKSEKEIISHRCLATEINFLPMLQIKLTSSMPESAWRTLCHGLYCCISSDALVYHASTFPSFFSSSFAAIQLIS